VKALLDEQLSPQIAELLRKTGPTSKPSPIARI
jgi:hypothetical protein